MKNRKFCNLKKVLQSCRKEFKKAVKQNNAIWNGMRRFPKGDLYLELFMRSIYSTGQSRSVKQIFR